MRSHLLTGLIAATALTSALMTAGSAATPKYGPWGVDYATMDRSVVPGDDFYGYAEGRFLKTAKIAPDKTGAGYNYDLPDLAQADVRKIAEDAAKMRGNPAARQIAAMYTAWMNAKAIEAKGLRPLKPHLAQINAVQSVPELVALMMKPGFATPFDIGIEHDVKDPTRYGVAVSQARLGLPSRDYYLLNDAKYVAFRKAYVAYIARIEALLGAKDGAQKAEKFLALETALAKAQWTPERRRDPQATYNPMDRKQLAALAPQIDWGQALTAARLGQVQVVRVSEPSAVAAAAEAVASQPLALWKDYLTFRFVSSHAAFLPHAFDQATFEFYSHTLRDVPVQQARWKRGVGLLDRSLGEAVGQIYVARRWSKATDDQMQELLGDLHDAYADKINHAAWMDAPTRTEALAKLATFEPRVGHPKTYIDYTAMKLRPDDALGNALAAEQFEQDLDLQRFPKPVDRGLWGMTPQTVNAYYDPTVNQVTFPAAILQPPFFDPAADPAVNYGETGATIGHEMGHGFDDEGRQFDAQGRLRDWWTPETAARYKAHADVLVHQFDGYEPIPGVHIKGQLTLGENLADLGGLEAASAAYRRYVARHGAPPVIDGFTGDQRFFIAYAQSWQGKQREGAMRAQLLSDPHSPDAYRVNGIVRNLDAWYAAFNVKPGDKLYLPPEQRVHVW